MGQKRFYRIAYLTFHVPYFLSKTHSFIYLCVCVDICTCVHAKTPEEGIRYLFSVFTCIFESGSLFKPGTCIFLANLKASKSQQSSWLQSPRNRVIDMYSMTSLLMWVLGSEFGLEIVNQMLLTAKPAASSASRLPFCAMTKNWS